MIGISVITIIVVLAVCVGTFYYPKQWLMVSAKPGSETYFIAFAHVLLLFQAAIALFLLLGLAGFAIEIRTKLWIFWQFLYLPSVPIISFTCPMLTAISLAWGIAGFLWFNYSLRVIAAIVMLSLTAWLNFWLMCLLDSPWPAHKTSTTGEFQGSDSVYEHEKVTATKIGECR